MQRLKCTICYDGTGFSGYQIQPNGRTVQYEIERVLTKMHKGEPIRVSASGRTDAGVHAIGQVIHFDSSLDMPESGWVKALNAQLPEDVRFVKAEKVSQDFHARFSAKRKEYRYRILNRKDHDLFRRHFVYHVPHTLNVDLMNEAAGYILGEHDFTSFCASGSSVKDKVRTVYDLDFTLNEDELVFRIVGNGFLYQMVRIIVGNLIEVGKGKTKPIQIKEIIEARDRRLAFYTAPSQGLYLWQVDYVKS